MFLPTCTCLQCEKLMNEARERIQKDKKDGEDVTSKLRAAKKLTA